MSAVFSAARHRALTFGDLGAYPERATASAWDDFGPLLDDWIEDASFAVAQTILNTATVIEFETAIVETVLAA